MKSLSEIPWESLLARSFSKSPITWNNQVIYLIVVDRFSDGNESGVLDEFGVIQRGTTPAFQATDRDNAVETEEQAARWRAAGDTFCGGTLQGIISKLGYLSRLGITTLWLTPILKQPPFDKAMYHGYGTANFLSVDPHFGTTSDFVELVSRAHQLGIYVILDIVFNHSGNVFKYDYPTESETEPPFNPNGSYKIEGFRDTSGLPTISPDHPSAADLGMAIIPSELQTSTAFHRRGCITSWEDPEQYRNGDFKFLKDFDLGQTVDNHFQPSLALLSLIEVYKYWIAISDIDGIRIDAVKHMPLEATALFSYEIRQFCQSLGKDNFLIMGEIPDSQTTAHQTLQATGLSASLAILDLPNLVENICLGKANPEDYFCYFAENTKPQPRPDAWKSAQIITSYDDHDQIRKGFDKARFGSLVADPRNQFLPIFLICTTLGMPALYYGSEQGFDGSGGDDNYIRECMFGGEFGALRSRNRHFFDESHYVYQNTQKLLGFRSTSVALQMGGQMLVQISGDGEHFGYPRMIGDRLQGIIAWIRQAEGQTLLCAMNTDQNNSAKAAIRLDNIIGTSVLALDMSAVFSSARGQSATAEKSGDISQTIILNMPQLSTLILELRVK